MEAEVLGTLTRLIELRNQDEDRSVALRASDSLLDRAGFKPTDKLKLSGDQDEPLEIVISRRAEPKQDEANHTDVPHPQTDGTSGGGMGNG